MRGSLPPRLEPAVGGLIGHHGVLPSFQLFRIPVTVQPTFLLVAAAVALFSGSSNWRFAVIWISVIFISILIHELGHALVARRFGADVAIELNGLGGLTRWGVPEGDLTPGPRALVAAAGSAVGLAFGGLVWAVSTWLGPFDEPLVRLAFRLLIYVNVFWGLLNWLPIRPLDGGHLLMSLLSKVAPRSKETVARVIFMATSAVALYLAIQNDLIFIAILAGWMLISEFRSGQPPTSPVDIPDFDYDTPLDPPRRRDEEWDDGEARRSPEQ